MLSYERPALLLYFFIFYLYKMDFASVGGIAGIIAIAIQTIQGLIAIVNHKRCRSTCCNYSLENSLDISDTTPPGIIRALNGGAVLEPINISQPKV